MKTEDIYQTIVDKTGCDFKDLTLESFRKLPLFVEGCQLLIKKLRKIKKKYLFL